MNGDLISRSAFIEFIRNLPKTENGYSREYDESDIIHYINEQLTAYDAEKVVEQTKDYFFKVIVNCEEENISHEILEYNKAICDIVRKGGVE